MSAYLKHQSLHSRTRIPIFMLRGMPDNRLLLYWPRYERNKISQNSIDKNPGISAFYQYHSGCVFYYRRIARKAEAGRDGSPRSINKSAMCPAMWRLTFSGGGRSVRLSANGCQPHRPNTALLFCAAVCRDYRLRTCSAVRS